MASVAPPAARLLAMLRILHEEEGRAREELAALVRYQSRRYLRVTLQRISKQRAALERSITHCYGVKPGIS